MANHSFAASLDYRAPLITDRSMQALGARYPNAPTGSLRMMLAQAGPFIADTNHHDAFAFTNHGGWNMTPDEAAELLKRAESAVNVVKWLVIDALRDATLAVRVGVPFMGPVGLPAVVVDEVIRRITNPLTDKIVSTIMAEVLPDFGRCGGMAFAALDYFLAGVDAPEDSMQPASGPLREFIWQRLLDSLDLNLSRLLGWHTELNIVPAISAMASALIGAVAGSMIGGPIGAAFGAVVGGTEDILGLGGAKVLAPRTRTELDTLGQRLSNYPAWPIGLIFDDTPFFWKQHQILALRQTSLGNGRYLLTVWDNNEDPDARMERDWTVDTNGGQVNVSGSNIRPRHVHIKGIICEQYIQAAPPA